MFLLLNFLHFLCLLITIKRTLYDGENESKHYIKKEPIKRHIFLGMGAGGVGDYFFLRQRIRIQKIDENQRNKMGGKGRGLCLVAIKLLFYIPDQEIGGKKRK